MKRDNVQKQSDEENDLEYMRNHMLNAMKVPLELFDEETETLYSRIDKEKDNYSNAPEHAIDHLTMAQAIMFEEFEGRDVHGIYTMFDDLIEKIQIYNLGE
jgi:hypothetical protein